MRKYEKPECASTKTMGRMGLINFLEFLKKSKHGGKNNYFLQIGKRKRKKMYRPISSNIRRGNSNIENIHFVEKVFKETGKKLNFEI